MSTRRVKRRSRPLYEQRQPFLVTVLTLAVMAVAAYLAAIFAYAFMNKVASAVGGSFFDDPAIRGAIVFIQLMAVVIGLIVPLFNRELDQGSRQFLLMLLLFIVGYDACKFAGLVDPNIPFNYFLQHVIVPLQRSIGH